MKTKREKQLEIALLKEKIERLSGKKVKFVIKEDRKPVSFKEIKDTILLYDEKKYIRYKLEDLYPSTRNPKPYDYFEKPVDETKFILETQFKDENGEPINYLVDTQGFDYCRYVSRIVK